MNCPECTRPMTRQPCKTPINYAAEIRWEMWRCDPCQLAAKVETIFYHYDAEPT